MNQPINLNDLYSTTDLALATTLVLYFPVERIQRSSDNRVEFLFKRDPSLNALLESYWRNQIRVNPRTYFDQLKAIKYRIREAK